MLAARVIRDQGIHVEDIHFFTGFCVEGHTHAIRHSSQDKPKRDNALWSAEQLGIKLHIVKVIDEHKDVVIIPSMAMARRQTQRENRALERDTRERKDATSELE